MTPEHADTPPDVAARHRRLLMARSGQERLEMATAMFDSARRLVEASLTERGVSDATEHRIATFRRFYERDLDPAFVRHVVERIAGAASPTA